MPKNYQQQVFTHFERNRDKQVLSLNLMQPTRSGLREECLHVYAEKGYPKNVPELRLFFGPIDVGSDYVQRIRNFDVDKFRPLVKFLKGETLITQDKNIGLLAWLIDFQSPPCRIKDEPQVHGKTYDVAKGGTNNKELAEVGNIELKEESFNEVPSMLSNKLQIPAETRRFSFPKKYKRTMAAFAASTIVFAGSSIFFKNSNQCMYWTGDHYESISCDKKVGDAAIIALDTFKVAHFKKITRPDTLTQNALGKVWYVKIKVDSAEFYTSAGDYPLNNRKRILPMTDYILNKYVLHK